MIEQTGRLVAHKHAAAVLAALDALWDRFAAADLTAEELKGYHGPDRSRKAIALREIADFVLFPEITLVAPRGHEWDHRIRHLAVDVGYFAHHWMRDTGSAFVKGAAYTLVHSLAQGGLCSGARPIAVQKAEAEAKRIQRDLNAERYQVAYRKKWHEVDDAGEPAWIAHEKATESADALGIVW